MITRMVESIRYRLGWCPNRVTAPPVRTFRYDKPVSIVPPRNRMSTMQDVILDSGLTGIPLLFFAIILCGVTVGLYALFYGFEGISPAIGLLVLGIFLLGAAAGMILHDGRTATIECTRDALTIRRPFFSPVIIRNDDITINVIQKNNFYALRWLYLIAMLIVPVAVVAFVIFTLQSHTASLLIPLFSSPVFFVNYPMVLVFFGLLAYRGYIRSRYRHVLAIGTDRENRVTLYVDDPGIITGWLSENRAGAI